MDLYQDERNSSYKLCLFPAILQVDDFGAKARALCDSHLFYQKYRKILYGFSNTEFWKGVGEEVKGSSETLLKLLGTSFLHQ